MGLTKQGLTTVLVLATAEVHLCLVLLLVCHELAGVSAPGHPPHRRTQACGPGYASTRVEAGESMWQITHRLLPACAQKQCTQHPSDISPLAASPMAVPNSREGRDLSSFHLESPRDSSDDGGGGVGRPHVHLWIC